MQASVPGLLDMSHEPPHILEMYGAKPGDGSFASNCLLARRLAERGVRFIQLYHRDWDHHSDVKNNLVFKAQEVDKPTAALITDLKQRGMLDDTLVVWGGEFGRTPMSQGRGGRDHHIKGFSFMLAGGGIRGGQVLGATMRPFWVLQRGMLLVAFIAVASTLLLIVLQRRRELAMLAAIGGAGAR